VSEEEIIFIRGVDTNRVSDGYHTFGELYEHRIELYLALCRYVGAYGTGTVWKSLCHSDGSRMLGWFILGIFEEVGKQITYHIPDKYWGEAYSDVILDKALEWDGHTSQDVIQRLRRL
jgi:hypothetical protein